MVQIPGRKKQHAGYTLKFQIRNHVEKNMFAKQQWESHEYRHLQVFSIMNFREAGP